VCEARQQPIAGNYDLIKNYVGAIEEYWYDRVDLNFEIQNEIKFIVDRIANKKKTKKKRRRLEELAK
jgi:hypothetical protein